MTKVIVGMSGGVDSSVSALLLKQQGYQVEGLFMKNWEEDDGTEYCTAIDDLNDAQNVCDTLEIKLHTANFAAEYWDNVFAYFLAEYQAGRTPNPDILCNKEIKFKTFLDYAKILGADFIATGHYVRRKGSKLLKALDTNKDQSYFLYALNDTQISSSLFPLGNLPKTLVRQIAEQNNLITAKKKDSTGICFIGERKFKDFLAKYLPAQPGQIINESNQVIGTHDGLMYYTIGQRQGLGIGGMQNSSGEPWFVIGKDLVTNKLIIGQGENNPALFARSLLVNDIHWINQPPNPYQMLTAKIRYRQKDQFCTLTKLESGFKIDFQEKQRAITPGQSIVFYHQDECLGGGIITKAI